MFVEIYEWKYTFLSGSFSFAFAFTFYTSHLPSSFTLFYLTFHPLITSSWLSQLPYFFIEFMSESRYRKKIPFLWAFFFSIYILQLPSSFTLFFPYLSSSHYIFLTFSAPSFLLRFWVHRKTEKGSFLCSSFTFILFYCIFLPSPNNLISS